MYKRIWRNEKYRLRNDGETSNDGDASTHPSCDDVSDGGATDAHSRPSSRDRSGHLRIRSCCRPSARSRLSDPEDWCIPL